MLASYFTFDYIILSPFSFLYFRYHYATLFVFIYCFHYAFIGLRRHYCLAGFAAAACRHDAIALMKTLLRHLRCITIIDTLSHIAAADIALR